MGLSIRARRWMLEQQRIRHAEREAAEAERERLAAEYHASFLDRARAAEYLGISVAKLRRLITAGTAPRYLKRGDSQQARTVWPIEELERYRTDPAAYLAATQADTATSPHS
jgi:hypothetical protein